jgi:hypothetical protein
MLGMSKKKPNLNPEGSEPEGYSNLSSESLSNGVTIEPTENGSALSGQESPKKSEIVMLKDRDRRGEKNREMWWECQWEGMDGFRGSSVKGRRCFDRVRVSWRNVV